MIFRDLPIEGAFGIEMELLHDERGEFARIYDEDEFARRGLRTHFPQWSISRNTRAGTLRGMHYSVGPAAETKLVRVTRGAMHDVLIDLRPNSTTRHKTVGLRLDAAMCVAVYVPVGVAHGFQTLVGDTEVLYHIGPSYVPEAGRGIRWDDPAFGIEWPPAENRIIAPRDCSYPDYLDSCESF